MEEVTLKFRDCEIEVKGCRTDAEATVYYDRNGDPGTPGCEAEFEVCEVWYNGVDVIDIIHEDYITEIETMILEGETL